MSTALEEQVKQLLLTAKLFAPFKQHPNKFEVEVLDGTSLRVHLNMFDGLNTEPLNPRNLESVDTSSLTLTNGRIISGGPQGIVVQYMYKLHIEEALVKLKLPEIKQSGKSLVWRRALAQWVKQHGFTKLGAGAYGMVFQHKEKKELLVKVFTDKAFFRWIQLCQTRLRGNPYIPKFKGKPVRLYPNADIWAIRLERLTPLDSWGTQVSREIREYITASVAANMGKYVNWDATTLKFARERFDDDNDFHEVMSEIMHYLSLGDNGLHFHVDLHPANMMYRGKQLVITDPLAPTIYFKNIASHEPKPSRPDTDVD